MKKNTKLEARERIALILKSALAVCQKGVSYSKVTREQIAQHAGMTPTLINYHMGTMEALRRDIMREAVRVECLPVVAQGLALRDRQALKAPDQLKQRAIQSLA